MSVYIRIKTVFFFVGSVIAFFVVSLLLLLVLIKPQKYAVRFDSLHAISAYAASVEEYPKNDAPSWINPDFSTYYRSLRPSFFDKILIRFGLKKGPGWSLGMFNFILNTVRVEREKLKMTDICAQIFLPKDTDRFFIWTDLQGSFHSLVRCLQYLKEQNIIDEKLRIRDGCYFIFNGNVFAHGPLILQTYTLILWLMHINPKQIFLIRSYFEHPKNWYNQQPANALRIFADKERDTEIPYATNIDAFMNTLPNALYLVQKSNDEYQAIEFTYMYEEKDMFLKSCTRTIEEVNQEKAKIVSYDQQGLIDSKLLYIRAILLTYLGEGKRFLFSQRPIGGLIPNGKVNGIFEWLTFSSPNGRSHQLYQFFYDVIIELKTQGSIDQWTIAETRNDVRDTAYFEFISMYNVVNGNRPDDAERIATLQKQIREVEQLLKEAKKKCAESALHRE